MKRPVFSKSEFLSTSAFGLLAIGILVLFIGSVVVRISEAIYNFIINTL